MTPLGPEGVLPIWLTHMLQQLGRQTLYEALPHLLASLYIPDNGAIKDWGPQMPGGVVYTMPPKGCMMWPLMCYRHTVGNLSPLLLLELRL